MARPKTPSAEQIGPDLVSKTPAHIAEKEILRKEAEAIAREMDEDRDLINQLLGQAQIAGASEDFFRTVRTSKLAFVKENKLYRTLKGKKFPNGLGVLSGTWEEFCNLLGSSVDKIDLDISNLRSFGEQALESMSRMGIGYRELRQFRKLPEDQKTALIEVAKAGDKDSFLEMAEDLIVKHTKEKEAICKEKEKLEKEKQEEIEAARRIREARDKTINDQQATIDNLHRQLAGKPDEEPELPEARALETLSSYAIEIVAHIDAGMRKCFVDLDNIFPDESPPNHVRLAQQQALTQVMQAARVLAGDYGIALKYTDELPQKLAWLEEAENMPLESDDE